MNKIAFHVITTAVLSLVFVVKSSAADDPTMKLLGTWKSTKVEGEDIGPIESMTFIFKPGGKCEIKAMLKKDESKGDEKSATYTVDEKMITFKLGEREEKVKYKFDGEKLILEDDEDDVHVYLERVKPKKEKANKDG